MLAIQTRYIGPGNVRGSRVKAEVMEPATSGLDGHMKRRTLTVDYDDALNSDDNHNAAARMLIAKLEWYGNWVRGHSEPGCVYVCTRRAVGGKWTIPNDTITVFEPGSVAERGFKKVVRS